MINIETSQTELKTTLEQAIIKSLYYYPIKSCGGWAVEQAEVLERGIKYDRELMVVEASTGKFITQRQLPTMALISPNIENDFLTLKAPQMPVFEMPLVTVGSTITSTVWKDTFDTVDQGDEAAKWLSEYLKTDCRLVRMPSSFKRSIDPKYSIRSTDQVGFADGFPFLLISEESLLDLNARLKQPPLPMNRFRPNIVLAGSGIPYAEDYMKRIRLGTITFDIVKPCARCAITTTDQATAKRNKEPLATLATYRRNEAGGVLFGQNLLHSNTGTLRVGENLKVLDLKGGE